MQRDDLPLFNWQPPCRVILFPLTNRIGKVRHTAQLLSRKHGEDAELYWKQVIAANRKHLSRMGISGADAERELAMFFNAVQSEMVRLSFVNQGNGGAA